MRASDAHRGNGPFKWINRSTNMQNVFSEIDMPEARMAAPAELTGGEHILGFLAARRERKLQEYVFPYLRKGGEDLREEVYFISLLREI